MDTSGARHRNSVRRDLPSATMSRKRSKGDTTIEEDWLARMRRRRQPAHTILQQCTCFGNGQRSHRMAAMNEFFSSDRLRSRCDFSLFPIIDIPLPSLSLKRTRRNGRETSYQGIIGINLQNRCLPRGKHGNALCRMYEQLVVAGSVAF